jgi:Domain of unknown function (DUF3846)
MEKLTVVHVEVGKEPVVKTIDHTLEEMHKLVGGYIETVRIAEDILLIVNETGMIDELPVNFVTLVSRNGELVPVHVIHGNVFFVTWDGEEFVSLNEEQVHRVKNMFKLDRKVCYVKQW